MFTKFIFTWKTCLNQSMNQGTEKIGIQQIKNPKAVNDYSQKNGGVYKKSKRKRKENCS